MRYYTSSYLVHHHKTLNAHLDFLGSLNMNNEYISLF